MSVYAITWAKKQVIPSSTAKLVLLCLADYADEHGCCWPSQRTLAVDASLCERTVRRQLNYLEKAGVLSRRKRTRPDGTRASDVCYLALTNITLNDQPADSVSGGSDNHPPDSQYQSTGLSVPIHRTLSTNPPDSQYQSTGLSVPIHRTLSTKSTGLCVRA